MAQCHHVTATWTSPSLRWRTARPVTASNNCCYTDGKEGTVISFCEAVMLQIEIAELDREKTELDDRGRQR